jgi:DNA end-binding protein Ku
MWSGSISFGLVNVPVKMFSAAQSKDVRFNQLHAKDGSRIAMKRFCVAEEAEVPFGELVKGYEVSPDEYVVITEDEMNALAPQVTQGIEIQEFVDLNEIDPVYFEHSYYLVPEKRAQKPYMLLVNAMREANKIALGRVVLRSKQYLTAIRPAAGGALAMSTLYFPDEVVQIADLDGLPDENQEFDQRELTMARQLIEVLATDFDPTKYRDEYREQLLDLIDRKAAGETIAAGPREVEAPRVVDLMAALEASIAAAKADRGAREKQPA